jgi:hypothetical protein
MNMKINTNKQTKSKSLSFCNIIYFSLILFGFQISFAQNTCSTAIPIVAGITVVDAINGTNSPSSCSTPTTLAEWYSYTPTANHTVTITSDLPVNICRDTYVNVYTGNCSALVCYAHDDDAGVIVCTTTNASYLSKVVFDAIAGTTYYISWDNRYDSNGFQFQLLEDAPIVNPCITATPITTGTTTVNAIDGQTIYTACSNATLAKWYSYTPTQDAHVTVSSDLPINICKNTYFAVYTGTCTSGMTCVASDDDSGIIQCNSGNINSLLSVKSFDVVAGTTYYIVWDNKWSTDGFDFTLAITPIFYPVSYTSIVTPTINSNYNICIVDMNGDHLDDVVGVSPTNLRIHHQGSTGLTFTDYPISNANQMPSWSMAAGDYNKDGFNDLILGSSGISVITSNSTGSAYTGSTPGEYIFCQRTNMADLNNDGNLDLFSCHDVAPNVYYLNDGSGNLTYYQCNVTPGAMNIANGGGNYSTLFTDFDNDGDTDVFISKCSGPPCQMFRNDGSGVYTNISTIAGLAITPIQTWSSGIADFDNDGDMDIVITASAGAHHFFRNNLDTTNNVEEAYTEITSGSGWDTNTSTNIDNVAYDFDNDGLVDILGGGSKIMFNKGGNTFEPTVYQAMSIGAIGDLNNDGFLDIQNGTTIRYAIPNGNNWFTVSLQGIQSNSNGIGARIEIYGPFGKQIRDIRSGQGFRYMSSLNAHFGLGQNTQITQVIIKWPSGIVDTINNPTINHSLNVVEGSTLSTASFTSSEFNLYPIPTKNLLNIKSTSNLIFASAEVYDLNGRRILNSAIENDSINVEQLTTGTYIIVLDDTNGKRYSQKFIKE